MMIASNGEKNKSFCKTIDTLETEELWNKHREKSKFQKENNK